MNRSALHVCRELKGQITLAFGESDEYSFLLRKDCKLYNRRGSKILTYIVSLFTSAYVYYWSEYMSTKLQYPPTFDGRIVLYPTEQHVRDYFSWRQADTHINNLYNTTFWALVQQGGMSERQAHERLKGTLSAEKNEILWRDFGVNYAHLAEIFRKGTVVVWTKKGGHENLNSKNGDQGQSGSGQVDDASDDGKSRKNKGKSDTESENGFQFAILHVDLIGDEFWSKEEDLTERARKRVEKMRFAREDNATIANTTVPDWEQPERLDGVGMGRWVL